MADDIVLGIAPTPAMLAGTSTLHSCNQCGTVVCLPTNVAPRKPSACPGCGMTAWTRQRPPCGPFHEEIRHG